MNNHDIPKKEAELSKSYELTNAITQALSQFIAEANPYILFNGLLDNLLSLTDSEYGFIGEVFYTNAGQPYIQSYATTNISWSDETRALYRKTEKQGLTFSKLNTLYGAVLTSGKYVISNDPSNDSRSGGVPKGHPPLNTFLGLPFYSGDSMLGVVGIANREAGYDEPLIQYLEPFLSTCGNLIQAYRNNQRRQLVEQELVSYKKRLNALVMERKVLNPAYGSSTHDQVPVNNQPLQTIELGSRYQYIPEHQTLHLADCVVSLTKKETQLLDVLVKNKNNIVTYRTIEETVWQNVIVSESSIRTLILRLRKKLPELEIKTLTGLGVTITVPS